MKDSDMASDNHITVLKGKLRELTRGLNEYRDGLIDEFMHGRPADMTMEDIDMTMAHACFEDDPELGWYTEGWKIQRELERVGCTSCPSVPALAWMSHVREAIEERAEAGNLFGKCPSGYPECNCEGVSLAEMKVCSNCHGEIAISGLSAERFEEEA